MPAIRRSTALSSSSESRPAEAAQWPTAEERIPLSWYFDPEVMAAEQAKILAQGPNYAGHVAMTPRAGDYHSVAATGHGQLLVNTGQGIRLVSNVCRHRQATMLLGRGHASAIVCPLHKWVYELDGQWRAAPHFQGEIGLDLESRPLQQWNGFLFAGPRDAAADLARADWPELDTSRYVLARTEEEEFPVNWKLYPEVFLDNLHVQPFHPGFRNFVDVNDLKVGNHTILGERFALPRIGIKDHLEKATSPNFEKYQACIRRLHDGRLPAFGAIWLLVYPNILIEWYPCLMTVSTYWPITPERTRITIEFYHEDDTVAADPEFAAVEAATWNEVQGEDDVIIREMHRGRRALWQAEQSDWGPYQSPMEDGLRLYHRYLRAQLDPALGRA